MSEKTPALTIAHVDYFPLLQKMKRTICFQKSQPDVLVHFTRQFAVCSPPRGRWENPQGRKFNTSPVTSLFGVRVHVCVCVCVFV